MKRRTILFFSITVILVILISVVTSLSEDNDSNDHTRIYARPADYFNPKVLLDHDDNVYFFWLSNAGYDYYERKSDLYFSKIDKDMHLRVYNKRILTNLTSAPYYVKRDSDNNFHISIGRVNCTYLKLNNNGDLIVNTSLSEVQILPDLPIIGVNGNELIYLKDDGVVDSDKNLSILAINYDRYNWSNYRENDGEIRRDILLTKYSINGTKIIENKTIFSISVDMYPFGREKLVMYPIEELDNNQAWTLIRRQHYSKSFVIIEANLTLNMNSGNYRTIFSKSFGSNRQDYYVMYDTDSNNKRHIFILDKGPSLNVSGDATVLYKSDYLSDYYSFYWDQKNETMIDFKVDSDLNINLLYLNNKELYYKKMKINETQLSPIVLHDGQTTSSGDYSIRLTPPDDSKTETTYTCGTIIYSIILFPFIIFIRRSNERMAVRKFFPIPPYDT